MRHPPSCFGAQAHCLPVFVLLAQCVSLFVPSHISLSVPSLFFPDLTCFAAHAFSLSFYPSASLFLFVSPRTRCLCHTCFSARAVSLSVSTFLPFSLCFISPSRSLFLTCFAARAVHSCSSRLSSEARRSAAVCRSATACCLSRATSACGEWGRGDERGVRGKWVEMMEE